MSKNETIVDRVVARLQSQPLGDLITEEDLHDVVKEAIPKTFFQSRGNVDQYGRANGTKEPVILEVMRELMQESAKQAVREWMIANAEMLVDHWKKVIDTGLLTYVQRLQDEQASIQVKQVLHSLLETINRERSQRGLPYLSL